MTELRWGLVHVAAVSALEMFNQPQEIRFRRYSTATPALTLSVECSSHPPTPSSPWRSLPRWSVKLTRRSRTLLRRRRSLPRWSSQYLERYVGARWQQDRGDGAGLLPSTLPAMVAAVSVSTCPPASILIDAEHVRSPPRR